MLFGIFRQLKANRWQISKIFMRDFTAPYKRSVLGLAWAVILPIIPITAYVLVRVVVRSSDADVHPAVYVAIGVTLWLLLKDCIMTPINSINKYGNLVTKTRFPLIGAITASFGQVAFDTILRVLATILVISIWGSINPTGFLMAIPLVLICCLCAFGIGLMLTPIVTIVPDLKNLMDIAFRYLIFFSYVIFPFPSKAWAEIAFLLNPFAVIIENTRNLIISGAPLGNPKYILIMVLLLIGVFFVSLYVFAKSRRYVREFII